MGVRRRKTAAATEDEGVDPLSAVSASRIATASKNQSSTAIYIVGFVWLACAVTGVGLIFYQQSHTIQGDAQQHADKTQVRSVICHVG